MDDLLKPKDWPHGKVGFVAIAGRPNVGKSTFLNAVLDYHLVAVSNKPQTTRKNWRGIYSDDDSQIIFVDTPGIHEGSTVLGDRMLDNINAIIQDADLTLCIADPTREPGEEDALVCERVAKTGKDVFLILNKTDEADQTAIDITRQFYQEALPKQECFTMSALKKEGLDEILTAIKGKLKEGPFYYEADQISDVIMREIGAEMIREAALEKLYQEVPHALAVGIDSWKDKPNKVHIHATIYVERDQQKGIVLGKGGSKLKEIRRDAISALREIQDLPVDLKLHVKVSPDWRNREDQLDEFGL